MTVYAIATVERRCFGHGDYGNVPCIQPTGAYGTGEFPPVYATRELAEQHSKGGVVVALRVIEGESVPVKFRKTYK